MARIDNLDNFLTDVSTAIKNKLGDNTPIAASDFDTKISTIPTQGTYENKTITSDGTYTAGQGYDGLGQLTVNVIDSEYATNLAITEEILGVSDLPYIELEYIRSTNTQYINTQILAKSTCSVDMCFKYDASGAEEYLFGGRDSYTSAVFQFDYANGGSNRFNYGWGVEHKYIIDKSKYNQKKLRLVTDGPQITISNYDTETVMDQRSFENATFSSRFPICLFALNDGGATSYRTSVELYYFKLYDNGILVRDFIPVKRREDNVICLYDKVSEAFFTNQGTGVFIAGPEKS